MLAAGKAAGLCALAACVWVCGCDSSGETNADTAGSSSGGSGAGSSSSSDGGFHPTGSGGSTNNGGGGGDDECTGELPATIRDFAISHPDFEDYSGTMAYTGIVEDVLGTDDKPVYAAAGATPQTSGPAAFAEWYHDVPGTNHTIAIGIPLTELTPGHFTYDNSAFFPIDNQGWGNEGNPHNYHFTTEVHTLFTYEGGEVFTFTGDDDLWLFINKHLAIDLGGLHPQLSDTIDLDASAVALDITVGETYAMDIFHAERHTDESNFRIQTTIKCFSPAPPPQ